MRFPRRLWLAVAIVALVTSGTASAHHLRHGQRFDPGATMEKRAERAPAELDRVAFMLGQWDVEYRLHDGDAFTVGRCTAEVTFVNRGHGLMEMLHCNDVDGQKRELDTLALLVFDPTSGAWGRGEISSLTESATLAGGNFEGDRLVLRDALRRRGSLQLTQYRHVIRPTESGFALRTRESVDDGKSWATTTEKLFTRRAASDHFMESVSEFGVPAPERAPEAAQFDFIVGRFDEQHEMTLPGGREVKFSVNGSGIHTLNGHAILEFSWYDVDPTVPDAATTIVRIYNRAMQRWECLYTTNRSNGLLYFGGRQDGDRIGLHLFASNTTDPISRFVFHDIGKHAYSWYGETSNDRGATYGRNWIIRATRQRKPVP